MSLRVGADRRTITPETGDPSRPVFLAGFQGDRRATGIDRDLWVRTLAVREDDGRPFVLAVCDLIGVPREDSLAIRHAVRDLEADVVVAATHTHSGPDTIGLWGPDPFTRGVDAGYLARVRTNTEASIRAAVAALEPAVIAAAVGEVDSVIRNYRDPEILDRQVGIVAFERPAGEPIATLVNVGVHPEVLDGDSTLVSPDLAGATCLEVETAHGGVALWVSGDLGGMQSPEEGPRTTDEVDRKASLVAGSVAALLRDAPRADEGRVRFRAAEVSLPLWNPRFRTGLESGLLRGALRQDGALVTDVAVVEVGPAALACWPGEVLPALGMVSKARLAPRVPILVGLANDELGYILPQDAFREPEDWDDPADRYEESMSVGPETGPRLLAALDALLG